MTPEERVERLVRVVQTPLGGARLGLVFADGSLVDPMIGGLYAVAYRDHLLAELRAAVAEAVTDALQRGAP